MSHKVFISYRRADSALAAQFLQRELAGRFGEEQIFFDRGIEPGANYVNTLRKAAGACEVLLAVIGPDWVDMKDDQGQRRLDVDGDWVRMEIATAFDRDIKVIPLLLRGASPPSRTKLPQDIKALSDTQALMLRDDDLDVGIKQLIGSIEKHLGLAKPSESEIEKRIRELVKQARLLKNEADEMYMSCIRSADKPEFDDTGRAQVDLAQMLEGFDSATHIRKLDEIHGLLKEANDLDPSNTEVLLLLAELLIELTPDDPSDEQIVLSRLQSVIGNPKDDQQRFQLAKGKFLLAQSGDGIHDELLRDARSAFEQLGRREWVRQCDDILATLNEPPAEVDPMPTAAPGQHVSAFNPVGNWMLRDSAAFPSQTFVQLFPNGALQGQQNTPALGLQVGLQGGWGFDPTTRALHMQGYVNGMAPFGLSIHLQGQSPQGWYGTGSDGNSYMITPA